jgi:hypothetical protein
MESPGRKERVQSVEINSQFSTVMPPEAGIALLVQHMQTKSGTPAFAWGDAMDGS